MAVEPCRSSVFALSVMSSQRSRPLSQAPSRRAGCADQGGVHTAAVSSKCIYGHPGAFLFHRSGIFGPYLLSARCAGSKAWPTSSWSFSVTILVRMGRTAAWRRTLHHGVVNGDEDPQADSGNLRSGQLPFGHAQDHAHQAHGHPALNSIANISQSHSQIKIEYLFRSAV